MGARRERSSGLRTSRSSSASCWRGVRARSRGENGFLVDPDDRVVCVSASGSCGQYDRRATGGDGRRVATHLYANFGPDRFGRALKRCFDRIASAVTDPVRILHVIRGLANSSGTTHIVGPLAEAQARQGTLSGVLRRETGQAGRRARSDAGGVAGFPMTVPTEHIGLVAPVRQGDDGRAARRPTWCTSTRSGTSQRGGRCGAARRRFRMSSRRRARWRTGRWSEPSVRKQSTPALGREAVLRPRRRHAGADRNRSRAVPTISVSRAPVEVLPNGVDLARSIACQRNRCSVRNSDFPPNSVLFLFLGRLFPKKGLDLLIPAFARLAAGAARGPADRGAGREPVTGQIVERLVQSRGVGRSVRSLGEVQGDRNSRSCAPPMFSCFPSYSGGPASRRPRSDGVRSPGRHHAWLQPRPTCAAIEAGWTADGNRRGVLVAAGCDHVGGSERHPPRNERPTTVTDRYTWDRIARESLRPYHRGAVIEVTRNRLPVSVIVLTHNEAVNIGPCLEALGLRRGRRRRFGQHGPDT